MATKFNPSVRNITRVFREATPEEVQAGIDWYADAYRIAGIFADRYEVTREVAAGVIAALSPLNSWGNNLNLAARFLEAGGLDAGYLKANLAKARAILAGAPIEATLSGLKVVNFYRSIVSEGREGICLDRHAISLAHNDRSMSNDVPSLSPKRYAELAEQYARAAKIVSRELGQTITPAVCQAITWKTWRNKWWSAGAFDGEGVS